MKKKRPISLILLADIQEGIFGINKIHNGNDRSHSDDIIAFTKNIIFQIINNHGLPSKDNLYALFALGDIASTANNSEYKIVCQQLLIIALKLRIPLKRIYLCPGNHDFSFEEDDDRKFRSYFDFNNYFYSRKLDKTYTYLSNRLSFSEAERVFYTTEFIENRHGRKFVNHQPNKLNYFAIDTDSGLEVLSFNSAYKCNKDESYGHVPLTDIITSLDNFDDLENIEPDNVRIAIGHHNFEAMDEADTSPIRNVKELKAFLFKNKFRFFFMVISTCTNIQNGSMEIQSYLQ